MNNYENIHMFPSQDFLIVHELSVCDFCEFPKFPLQLDIFIDIEKTIGLGGRRINYRVTL